MSTTSQQPDLPWEVSLTTAPIAAENGISPDLDLDPDQDLGIQTLSGPTTTATATLSELRLKLKKLLSAPLGIPKTPEAIAWAVSILLSAGLTVASVAKSDTATGETIRDASETIALYTEAVQILAEEALGRESQQ